MRDPLSRLVEYNRAFAGEGRDPAWLRLKLSRLRASPFAFLRGTFHLFMADWPQFGDDPLADGPPLPIVGDLHLENFGAFKTKTVGFVFDVNDFDETGVGTPAIDLLRVATSLLLADEKHGQLRAVERIEAFVGAYVKAAVELDLRPLGPDTAELPRVVLDAIDKAGRLSRGEWLGRYIADDRFLASDRHQPLVDGAVRGAVLEAARPWGEPIDAATRIAGTGSLGRFRYAVLLAHGDKRLVIELKEARPSSLEPTGAAAAQAERVIAHQQRLQGASPRHLGTATIAGRAFTVRELQPTDAKLKSDSLKGADRDALCATCGSVLGRLHARGDRELRARLTGRERGLLRRVAAFALRYGEVVCEDYERLRAAGDLFPFVQ